jgi:tetratricopeptide (TPR) repeat protein
VPHGIGRLRMTRATAALLAALAGFAVFAPTLGYEFVWDDRATVVHNRAIRSLANAPSFFTGHAFSGASEDLRDIRVIEYYRPVWVLSLAVNHAVWGERPLGYHLSNVLLHALASGLTAWLVFELAGDAAAAALAGLLFAVHPVHAEAVAWVSARNELLLCVFVLLAFLSYLRMRRETARGAARSGAAPGPAWRAGAACVAFFAVALLSKETAVLFPALVALYEWTAASPPGARHRDAAQAPGGGRGAGAGARDRGASAAVAGARSQAPPPASWRRYAWALSLAAIAAAFILLRARVVSPLPVHDPLATRLATAPGLVLANLRLLFVPIGLRVLHTFEPVTSPGAAFLPAVALLGLLALLPWVFRRNASLGFGLAWILIALIPVSGLPALLQPTPLAERYLYLPSVGWAIAIGSLIARAPMRAATRTAALALAALFSAGAIAHSRPWRDELSLATRMCRDAPRSALAHSSLGLAQYRLARWPEAAMQFTLATELGPADPWSHYYLGASLRRAGSLEPAERSLRDAIARGMRYAPAHLDLAETLESQGRLGEAERECRAALALDPGLPEAHAALGRVLYAGRRWDEAERAYRAALALAPGDARTRSNLGGLYLAQRRWDEAIAELDSARAADPRLAEAHFNLGSALFERGRLEEAVSALRAGLALQPGAADERLALARALLAAGDREAAAREAGEVLRSGVADSALRRGAERALEQARRP